MKKFIIIFIIAILLLAIIIGQCSNSGDSDYYDDEEIEEFEGEQGEIPSAPSTLVDTPKGEQQATNSDVYDGTALELPNVTSDIPNQILKRIAYTVSYNKKTKCANWVAWHLLAEHTDGPYSRKGVPYYDDKGNACGIGPVTAETQRGDYFLDLQSEEPRQQLTDWPNNEYGMEHGHLCPAADNRWSMEAMNQSFLLTNMCPQTHQLNSGVWQSLEDDCRSWAVKYNDIYIAAGPIFYNGLTRTIGQGKVGVPDAFFKVILRMNPTQEAIGFIYPNDGSYGDRKNYVKSVDDVESITGIDFFYNLPDEIEKQVESKASLTAW